MEFRVDPRCPNEMPQPSAIRLRRWFLPCFRIVRVRVPTERIDVLHVRQTGRHGADVTMTPKKTRRGLISATCFALNEGGRLWIFLPCAWRDDVRHCAPRHQVLSHDGRFGGRQWRGFDSFAFSLGEVWNGWLGAGMKSNTVLLRVYTITTQAGKISMDMTMSIECINPFTARE